MSDTRPYTIAANSVTPGHLGATVMFETADGATVQDVLVSLQAAAPTEATAEVFFADRKRFIQFGLKTVRPFYDLVMKRGGEVFDVCADTEVTVLP